MGKLAGTPFYVNEWLVEPELNRIERSGDSLKLEPHTMDVLVYLAGKAGDVVCREELLARLWADQFVAENTLSRTISRLRKALGDDWRNPRFLETINKSGYRWIADTRPVTDAAAGRPAPAPGEARRPVRRDRAGTRRYGLALALLALVAVLATMGRRAANSGPAVVQPQPAVTLVGRQWAPVLSPDGASVAFAWQGPGQDNWDIYVQSIGADNPRRITEGVETELFPAWSPDGRHLAFAGQAEAGAVEGAIFRAPVLGGPKITLAPCSPRIRNLNWSPDGRRILFDDAPEAGQAQALFALDLADGSVRPFLAPPENGGGYWDPVHAPDGRAVAFLHKQDKDLHHLWLVSADGGKPTRLTRHTVGRIRGHDWTPDGRALIYSYNRDGRYALWRIPIDGGRPQRLPIYDEWATYPSLAREGHRLTYKNYADVVDIWSVNLAEGRPVGEPVRAAPSTRSELHPSLAPKGDKLAFVSNRTGAFEVWSGDPDGGALIRHTRLEGRSVGTAVWSPDGAALLYDARVGRSNDLFLVFAGSRNPRRLTDHPADEVNGSFTRDGARILFASNRSGVWQIYSRPLSGGPVERRTEGGGFFAREGPEGRYLYFTRLNETAVYRVPFAGGPEETALDGLGVNDWGNWAVARGGLYYIRHYPTAVMFAGFGDGQEPSVVYQPPRQIPYLGPALAISADERRLYFGQIAQSDDEVLAVDLPAFR